MINPLKKYETLAEACEQVKFEISYPNRYKIKQVFVVADKILELRFASITVRKAKYSKDLIDINGISGVYFGGYPNNCRKDEINDENVGYQYWNGSTMNPKAYLAVFDDFKHDFSYSIYAPKGVSLKTMENWRKNFK